MTVHVSVPRSTRRRINLTPLIDVVFILLVFFMLETTFLVEGGIDVLGTQAANTADAPTEKLVVEIFDAQYIWINGKRVAYGQWLQTISQFDDRPVEVRTATSIPVERIVNVLDALAARGFKQIQLGRIRGFET